MSRTLRAFTALLVVAALIYAGYRVGRHFGRSGVQTQLIENYSFVREIAQLATLEVSGTTAFTATNLANDGSFSDAMKQFFAEKTVHLSVPYTAKFGIDLQDSSLRIERADSATVLIHLPAPKLLSYELRLDRMDATSREGILFSSKADLYTVYQKQLYTDSRKQLEGNTRYLSQTASGVTRLLEKYFAAAGLKARCIFDLPGLTVTPKG